MKKKFKTQDRPVSATRKPDPPLGESEEREQLDGILSPEGDLGELDLADIIDVNAIQALMDDCYKLTHIPMSIVDLKDRVLVGVGWQDICVKFHRTHPETCQKCRESDTQLTTHIPPGEFRLYKCKNHMWDIATPIIIGGHQVGNLFMGQFFFEDELVDRELFRRQARQYGFEEAEYLAALEKVPRLNREAVLTGMRFFIQLAHMLSLLSYSNLKLVRSLAEREALLEERQQAERALRQNEAKFRSYVEQAPLGVFVTDGQGHYVEVNPTALKLLGYDAATLLSLSIPDIVAEEDQPAVLRDFATLKSQGHIEREYRMKRADGRLIWTALRAVKISEQRFMGFCHDITKRKQDEQSLYRANRALRAISECQEALLRTTNEQDLLKEICRIIVEIGGKRMAWVGYAEQDAHKTVRPVAQAGFTDGYVERAQITWANTPHGCGPIGTAIRTGKVSMCLDTAADPRFAPWREEARKRGYGSLIALPLVRESEKLGVLAIYAPEPNAFDTEDQPLLLNLANNLALGITALRTRSARERLERELLQISEREQQRIARDVHDGLCQQLLGVSCIASVLHRRLVSQKHPDAATAKRVLELLSAVGEDARKLSHGLHPVKPTPEGLMEALDQLAHTITNVFHIRCYFRCLKPVFLEEPDVATHLFRIAQEAVNNAVKHGQAKQIVIHLRLNQNTVLLTVRDNGRGVPRKLPPQRGLGLQIMSSRAAMIGGSIQLQRMEQGGMMVTCSAACPEAHAKGPRRSKGLPSANPQLGSKRA